MSNQTESDAKLVATTYKVTFDHMVDYLLRTGHAGLIEEIYVEAQEKWDAATAGSSDERKWTAVVHALAKSSWDRAAATGKLDERIAAEVRGLAQLHFNKSPEQLAAEVEAQPHPAGDEVKRRIVAGLRAHKRGPVGPIMKP